MNKGFQIISSMVGIACDGTVSRTNRKRALKLPRRFITDVKMVKLDTHKIQELSQSMVQEAEQALASGEKALQAARRIPK